MERNAAAHLIRLCAIVYMEIATVSFLPWLLWAQGSNLAKLNFGPCGTLDSSLNLIVRVVALLSTRKYLRLSLIGLPSEHIVFIHTLVYHKTLPKKGLILNYIITS